MIYKCPNCASALLYDPEENKLICHSCDSTFNPEEIDITYMPKMRMNFSIFSCTACGAEVMVKENEAATYCIYCGQPVIVFDRVSSELQPDYIIPFKTTKEVAQAALRHSIRKKFFVPKAFKNFEADTLRGIYIPFWLYDIDYKDKQYFHVTTKVMGGTREESRGYCQEMQTIFKDLPINASTALNDEELQLLGKYYLEEMEPFNPGYLSGFYADRYDIDYEQAAEEALKKAEKIYDYEAKQRLYSQKYETVILRHKAPEAKFQKLRYIMLPVWFMTFRYKNRPYTLLVNGQTGMTAGNLPIQKSKAFILFAAISSIASIPFGLIAYTLYLAYIHNQLHPSYIPLFAVPYLFFIISGLVLGRIGVNSIRKGLNFSQSFKVSKYVKERQEV